MQADFLAFSQPDVSHREQRSPSYQIQKITYANLGQDNKARTLHCNGRIGFLPARSSSQKLMLLLSVCDGHKWQRAKAQSGCGCRGRQDMADDGSGLGTGEDSTSLSRQPALASVAPAIGRGALQGHSLIIPCRQSYSVTCN